LKRTDAATKALDRAAAAADWHVRAGAANMAIRVLGKDAGLAFAKKLIADKVQDVQLAAARVLAHGGDRDAASTVFASALAGDAAISAAADLAELGDPRGLDLLDRVVRDGARAPDQRAQAALAYRTARRITPGLGGALADPNGVVRVEAAAAIAAIAR